MNCTQTGGGLNTVPLIVPVGAKLISIEVDVIDGAAATLYSLQLIKYTVNPTGSTIAEAIATPPAQGASTGSAPRVHHTMVPTTPEVVEAGESFDLEVNTTIGQRLLRRHAQLRDVRLRRPHDARCQQRVELVRAVAVVPFRRQA